MGKESGKESKKAKVPSESCMDNKRSLSTDLKLQESKDGQTVLAGKPTRDRVSRGSPYPARSIDGIVRKSGRRLRLRFSRKGRRRGPGHFRTSAFRLSQRPR